MTIHPSLPGAFPARSPLVFLVALLLAGGLVPAKATAQQPASDADSIFELRLGDGTRTYGRVVESRDDQIVFETVAGVRMEVNRAYARLQPARGRVVDGEFWPEDRHTTRLFFAPTGRTLRTGEGYAGMFFVLPFVGYGATDNVTLAGGMPLIGSLETVPVWIAPKVRVHNAPGSQVSAGLFAVHVPGSEYWDYNPVTGASATRREPSQLVGIAYGVGTFGDQDNALHLGTGVTFGGDDTEVPFMLGGEFRTSRRHKLVTENWLLPVLGGGALSGGIRFMGDRWTTDLGLMAIFGTRGWNGDTIPYFPIVSFSYAFGGRG